MIIGRMSIDPKSVIASTVSNDRGRWYLTVKVKVGDETLEIDDYFDSESTALDWQEQLDGFCYKGEPVSKTVTDAISGSSVYEDDGDSFTITEALIENCYRNYHKAHSQGTHQSVGNCSSIFRSFPGLLFLTRIPSPAYLTLPSVVRALRTAARLAVVIFRRPPLSIYKYSVPMYIVPVFGGVGHFESSFSLSASNTFISSPVNRPNRSSSWSLTAHCRKSPCL